MHIGADAILRARSLRPNGSWTYAAYRHSAVARWLCDRVYGFIASHRRLTSAVSRRLIGPSLLPAQHLLTRWLLLRLLGIAALCAFASMLVQMDGLFLSDGIQPAADHMASAARYADHQAWGTLRRFVEVPTLAWLATSDRFLTALAVAGLLLSLLLIADIAPGPCLLLLWLLYLSLVQVGGAFFFFQWDTLLLESLFTAMFFAPWRVRPRLRSDRAPPAAGLWLMRLLLVKLMLLSGLVKLQAHDHSWADLSALDVHFFTQPIPTWTAYYAHFSPGWLLALATAVTLFIELALPWFALGPRRLRMGFAIGTLLLMLGIGATGNYGFFNLLTVALTISLFDDAALRRCIPKRWQRHLPGADAPAPSHGRTARRTLWAVATVLLLLSAIAAHGRLHRRSESAAWLNRTIGSFLSINGYGLFQDMTTRRLEITIEGSQDGQTWLPYVFHHKPGPVDRRPGFIGPHMPRLDWQLWFAALGGCADSPWFHQLLFRLLQNSPAVTGLFEQVPFDGAPPRYLRTRVADYTYAPLDAPAWWQARPIGPFCPTVTLQSGSLAPVDLPGDLP